MRKPTNRSSPEVHEHPVRRNGVTGSTTAASSSPSGTSRRQKLKRTPTQVWKLNPWPRNQHQQASGRPDAVQWFCALLSRAGASSTLRPLG